jgi:ABC-type polysaccharide/polyol phosphate transport system ATPase subunit
MKSVSSTASDPGHDDSQAAVRLQQVALRFILYSDKGALLKEAALSRVLNRLRRMHETQEFWALQDVTLNIEHGQRVGVIGVNGAGKSTLLKTIAGIYLPTRGRIEVAGRVAPLINIGAGFNHNLSARENVILYGALLGHPREEMDEKVQRILAFAGVRRFAEVPTKYFSSGMLMRLGFAVATDILPEILLIDEVFAAGDAKFRVRARDRMLQLIDSAKLLVLVSHSLELVQEVCGRVIWIDAGRIIADGDPRSVCESYLNREAVSGAPGLLGE